ncbi:extracellular solute-binding protein [Paenibacillus eucommiae]|uniref:Multiple sugar transport system substrate-binding protein n=1 Tax=Paenibacillus eucommiae TaxID=1355755 RepID=A0ABS4IT31_9BACL|nr:extracellular solute-binding protein [Paenibacillus eucommiae]MBP1990726.1 multiple sugar transport system substrate-binding protein [Paenibacillus eucommiae]
MDSTAKTSRKSFHSRLRHMVDSLRADILNGTYAPGELLPSERKLAEQFRLSNKSVRIGLETLISHGFIHKVDRVGSRVSEGTPEGVSLSFGYSTTIERDFSLSSLLEDFRSLHPSIRVKAMPIKSTSDYMSTVKEYMENGILDIFTLNNLDFQHSCDNSCRDILEPLDWDKEQYRFAQDAFVSEEALFARPVLFSPIVIAYNRSHFREAGVPEPDGSWNWSDMIQHASALTVPGKRHGFYFYLLSDNRWPAFLLLSGMRFEADSGGGYELAGSRMLESIRLSKQLIDNRNIFPNYLSENSDDVNELFRQGKVSMIMTNYMTINDFKHTDLDYDISPLPHLYEPRSLLNVIGVAVSRSSKEKEAAKLLADYFASPRAQQIIRAKTLSLPSRKVIAESPVEEPDGMNRPSRYFLFREIMASYRLHRELNLSPEAFNALRQLLKQYWFGFIDEVVLCELTKEMLNRE